LRTHVGRVPRFDNSRIQRELGVTFRPIEDTLQDTMADLERWGHIAHR
jgi:dihydroflavonol-4-reductase